MLAFVELRASTSQSMQRTSPSSLICNKYFDPFSIAIKPNDEDITQALRQYEGYIDIFSSDLSAIYEIAQKHAAKRHMSSINALSLMRKGVAPLSPEAYLDQAAIDISQSGFSVLPVVDREGQLLGMLAETEFLGKLSSKTFFSGIAENPALAFDLVRGWNTKSVREAMKVVFPILKDNASYHDILSTLQESSMDVLPVVSNEGLYIGLLVRSDLPA